MTDQRDGFSVRVVDGQSWRVFALADAAKGIRILVGDYIDERRKLERGIVSALLLTASCVLPALALLIWLSIKRGLRPLSIVASDLASRDADDLDRVDLDRTPAEIRPLVDALNRLFGKVGAARDHERSFLAYAAHELRTPLAGLKTQVQVAMSAPTDEVRDAALKQTLAAVDRSARLVRQLLAMSRLDASTQAVHPRWIGIEDCLRDLLATTDRAQAPERIVLAQDLESVEVMMDEGLFDLSMRNLLENALLMTPATGGVYLSVHRKGDGSGVISLEDDGPGIAPAEREIVLQRFVRGTKRATIGSGLGLSIVVAALERSGATLSLGPRENAPGLRADVLFGPGAFRTASTSAHGPYEIARDVHSSAA